MAYPTNLDSFTTHTNGEVIDASFDNAQQVAISALEAKVGIDGSLVTTSHSYKLGNVAGSDKAVSLTGTEALTNKTLTAPKINLGSDASQDLYKRKADGTLERIPLGSANQLLGVNPAGDSVGYLALSAVTGDEKAALAGTSGTPSATNKFVTADDVTTAKTASKIARRDANGDVLVSTTPTDGDAATSKTYADKTLRLSASDNLKYSADTERSYTLTASYTLKKSIQVFKSGTIRVKHDQSDASATDNYTKVYVNGVAAGAEHANSSGSYVTYSDDISVREGDFVQLYAYNNNNANAGYVKNFRIYYDIIAKVENGTVITD